jgi:hypothetical protein
MSDPIVLSVDGLPGIDQAIEREAHLIPTSGTGVVRVSIHP